MFTVQNMHLCCLTDVSLLRHITTPGPSRSKAQVALVKVIATFQTHHRDLTGKTKTFDGLTLEI